MRASAGGRGFRPFALSFAENEPIDGIAGQRVEGLGSGWNAHHFRPASIDMPLSAALVARRFARDRSARRRSMLKISDDGIGQLARRRHLQMRIRVGKCFVQPAFRGFAGTQDPVPLLEIGLRIQHEPAHGRTQF